MVKLEEVEKITIESASSGLSEHTKETYDITRSTEGWVSQRTSLLHGFNNINAKIPSTINNAKIAISSIEQELIDGLLSAVNNAKAVSPSKSLGITPDFLKTNADTILSKFGAEHPYVTYKDLGLLNKNEITVLKNGVTTDRIDEAIKHTFEFYVSATDYSAYRQINIVKKDGGIIRLSCYKTRELSLPWMVSSKDTTYDVGISRFCAKAVGDESFTTRQRSRENELYGYIYFDIYRKYFQDNFNYEFFKKEYPDSYKKLSAHFLISHVFFNRSDLKVAYVQLHSRYNPKNINISATLQVSDPSDIVSLLNYSDAINSALKKDNFIMRYINKTPNCEVTFHYRRIRGVGFTDKPYKQEVLQNFPGNSIIALSIKEHAKDLSTSEWYFLPDGSFVLTDFRGHGPLSFIPDSSSIRIPNTVSNEDVCVVFNSSGEVIKNYTP